MQIAIKILCRAVPFSNIPNTEKKSDMIIMTDRMCLPHNVV